jgi:hypothetical protein
MPLGRYLANQVKEHGAPQTWRLFTESLNEGKITADDFSLREAAESILGPGWDQKMLRGGCRMNMPAGVSGDGVPLGMFMEAGDAVDSSMFADITGQILFQEIKAQYEAADFLGDQLCRVMPVTNRNLGTEKIPYLSPVLDNPPHVQQGMPYPRTSFTQQYVTLPAPVKFGEICAVTMEMIFSDHTMQARESAGSVGLRTRQTKEEMILQVVLGITNPYVFNGTSVNTYNTSTPFINSVGSTALTDAESINVAEQLLGEMTDPVTGKPIMVKPNLLLVMPYRYRLARRIMGASYIRMGDGASTSIATTSPDFLEDYPVAKTRYGYHLLTSSATPTGNNLVGGGVAAADAIDYWYLGDFKKAFVWRQVFPLQTFLAPPQAPEDFNNDIVLQVKAREYGVAGVYDPRYVVKMYEG